MKQCERCGAALDPGEKCDCGNDQELALRVIQAPVIFEDLGSVRQSLDSMLAAVRELPKNDESLKRVRAMRAAAAKQFAALEEQRKDVKRQVMQPYDEAMEIYRKSISSPYDAADRELKAWVDSYQQEMKDAKEAELREYFQECCKSQNIDFLRFEDMQMPISMAVARQKESKAILDRIRNFVCAIRGEVNVILDMPDAQEILAEYRKCLNITRAVAVVQDRKTAAKAMQEVIEMQRAYKQEQDAHRAELTAAAPEILEEEPQYSVAFLATGSLAALKSMKAHAAALGIILEEIQQEDTQI